MDNIQHFWSSLKYEQSRSEHNILNLPRKTTVIINGIRREYSLKSDTYTAYDAHFSDLIYLGTGDESTIKVIF